jgi:hypothetical protein
MPVACCRRRLDGGEPLFSAKGRKCKSSPVIRPISPTQNDANISFRDGYLFFISFVFPIYAYCLYLHSPIVQTFSLC